MPLHLAEAPIQPIPADPNICRWCLQRMGTYGDGVRFCQAGCELEPIYLGQCLDCSRPFRTGARWASHQCWPCSRKELTAIRADAVTAADEDYQPRWTKAAMRERLGVSGNRDE